MILRVIYTLVLYLVAPFLLFGLYRKKVGKPSVGKRWVEHFGQTPGLAPNSNPIWIHAVSVGEVIAATPIINALKKISPEQVILVTTTTSTGAEQVKKLENLVEHRYMPLDFPFAVKSFVRKTKPRNLLIMETELWPNTLHIISELGIPISVMNARLSEKSFLGYKRALPLLKAPLSKVSHFCCQYKDDANRFIALGIPPHKIHVTGSVKFDIQVSDQHLKQGQELRRQFGCQRPIWIAASTHRGEDEKILDAHKQLLQKIPESLLILVPRHPERFDSVADLCRKYNFSLQRRTQHNVSLEGAQVYLGDTMGEMLTLMQASDVCFMGGSLLGSKVGGHNILEPLALGLATLIGPSYYNFQEIVDSASRQGACQITTEEQLSSCIINLFDSRDSVVELSKNAQKLMERNQGATSKTIDIVKCVR
ncbi:lipid IV(A) 3-deoxy-D-manno-octulosonic acid transferase [Vibrio crassostreae]|uniref:lipid IV(A) 3-deoxy-D-manno-octulosonic acid transferase n=1 Tax=Vibrio crassostreae TaxID=246167 RepID=UPI001045FFCB|nr:lipid IV(A) 3-deoxy-D-manno-octulosonic acid transferase [Vibrio crassostreae]TCN92826.1 3-deoxy-D-manno-octulosonic-acid transferase [Vibrio crassostreae]CAK1934322.1 3-deoxy-D-manno-octulosonic acid transferase [Vibrio crassostreae]CAK1942538.1 3-deoxy-D-manno-octulosonic acid transferase [Vibrio crassostreae]CAK1947902.1 3-deoxy-D-manno-octulosonic acid transferase [Vibrio crassostreae]CAK2709831.1 3-deoxy-D-manno-octulosonic acid transferase [Vibrio crassostreae]